MASFRLNRWWKNLTLTLISCEHLTNTVTFTYCLVDLLFIIAHYNDIHDVITSDTRNTTGMKPSTTSLWCVVCGLILHTTLHSKSRYPPWS